MSHACTSILMGVAILVSEILLLSKTVKFPFLTMDYSPFIVIKPHEGIFTMDAYACLSMNVNVPQLTGIGHPFAIVCCLYKSCAHTILCLHTIQVNGSERKA